MLCHVPGVVENGSGLVPDGLLVEKGAMPLPHLLEHHLVALSMPAVPWSVVAAS